MATPTWKPIAPSTNPIDNAVDPNQYPGGQVATGPGGAAPSAIQQALAFLGTPGGSAVTNMAGSALSAYGQYQQQQQQLGQNAAQFGAKSAQDQYNADQNLKAQRANGVLNADPLGADQKYAQSNALRAAILPNLRNSKSTPGDGAVASAMGSRTGGIANILPENGLDPAMVASMFGPNATMQAITQRHQEINNLDPSAPTADLSKMYGSTAAAPFNKAQGDWQAQVQNLDANQKAAFESKMNGYIQQMVNQENNSGGFWHKFAQIAGVVGSVAAIALTGGAAAPILGPVAASILGAGSAAATAWGSGGSPLQSAIAGGVGGVSGFKAGK